MPKAFDTTGCGIDAPDAIESFRLISNCVIDDPPPPILEPDDLDLFIPTEFTGSEDFPCPDVDIQADADLLEPGAQPTVTVQKLPVPGSLGCAHSFLFLFGVPQGDPGPQGSQGPRGSRGSTGSRGPCPIVDVTADLNVLGSNEVGDVIVTPGGSACRPSFHFDFYVPRGERGSDGPQGPQGPPGADGEDGITTVITDCADPAGTTELGPFVTDVSISSNGFNRIYLDVSAKPLSLSLSECGVISITEGDTVSERKRVLLDLDRFCQYCCDHNCDSSSSSEDCADCSFTVEIGGEVYVMATLVPGLIWTDVGNLGVTLTAPGEGVCVGDWRIETQFEGAGICTWYGYWNGRGCLVFYLDEGTSTDCPHLTAHVCCEDIQPSSSVGPVLFNCCCADGVPSPIYFQPVAITGFDCSGCTFSGESYLLTEISPNVFGWSGTLCGYAFSIELYCVEAAPAHTDVEYTMTWQLIAQGPDPTTIGRLSDGSEVTPTCDPFMVETITSLTNASCDMGIGNFQWLLHG